MSEINTTRIILARPRNPRNIGAVARAMANFGLADLVVVAPHPPVWEEARVAGVGADDVITNARVADELIEAVGDCTLVIGSADQRRGRGVAPAQAVDLIAGSSGKAAILFGCEKSGLTNADLSFCHDVLTIPTSEECPSLNLGQAVAIVCYELSLGQSHPHREVESVTIGEIDLLLRKSMDLLNVAGYFAGGNRTRLTEEFRQSLLRQRPTPRDLALWTGAIHHLRSKVRPPN